MTPKDTINKIKAYISAKGFTYEDGMIENFYLSLKAKPFVILAGTSGTGKTRLVKLFAEAVGAEYAIISVRPDWSDSSDLFGHVNLDGEFLPGEAIDFISQAAKDTAHPYFLCLDEMNLARVEYYLSDFLSVIETRDYDENGLLTSKPLIKNCYGRDAAAAAKYGTIIFPENLYVIGTVNMDETTFPFSRKVLDRANAIEFSHVDLMPNFPVDASAAEDTPPEKILLPNSFFRTDYLFLNQCKDEAATVNDYCAELQKINGILRTAEAHVGYRVRDEIVFYLLQNKRTGLLAENDAMDNAIMQKILPRLQGGSATLKNTLCELFKLCAGDYTPQQVEADDAGPSMLKHLENNSAKYGRSAEKIAFMVRRYEEDGFTSYWL